jgi:hypothetical protein
MHSSVPRRRACERGGGRRRRPTARLPAVLAGWSTRDSAPRAFLPTTTDNPLAGPFRARGPRAGNTTPTMYDRERLQWLPTRARRDRATAWGITLLHTLPLIAACLLALLLGRPEIAAATLGLAMLTLGLVRALTRPRKLAMARIRPGLREVRRGH